jgi:glycosyltransferase involved in cell wall biosynthesis
MQSSSPFFSIIIPTYNSANTLGKAINSILNQTFKSFEVIIVDGVSTDTTLQILSALKDDRIKIFSEKDEGIYDAMNKGIKKAEGNWLYFMGSDDELFDENVLQQVQHFITHYKRKAHVFYGNVLTRGTSIWAKDNQVYDGYFDLKKIIQKNICHQAMFYNKEIFVHHLYNKDLKVCADYELNLKLFNKYNFAYIDRIIAIFNSGGESSIKRDLEFNRFTQVVKHFKYKLWKPEFKPFMNAIRLEAKLSNNIFKKLFYNIMYLPHKVSNLFLKK